MGGSLAQFVLVGLLYDVVLVLYFNVVVCLAQFFGEFVQFMGKNEIFCLVRGINVVGFFSKEVGKILEDLKQIVLGVEYCYGVFVLQIVLVEVWVIVVRVNVLFGRLVDLYGQCRFGISLIQDFCKVGFLFYFVNFRVFIIVGNVKQVGVFYLRCVQGSKLFSFNFKYMGSGSEGFYIINYGGFLVVIFFYWEISLDVWFVF